MKILRVLICCLVIIALLPFAACDEKTNHSEWEQLNWQLYGAWVSESGVKSEKIAISFSGKMPTDISEDHCLHEIEVQIEFPDNFPYQQDNKEMTAICMRSDENTRSYFHCDGFSSNKSTLKADKITFYVFPDTEQIVFQWSDSEGRYFVAATDPDADPAEILNLYLECFDANYGSPNQ